MDHELKQRLIGAVVVTALCAIFIPMLFDDPVDNNSQLVSGLKIPAPVELDAGTAAKLPTNADQVLKLPDPEPLSGEPAGDILESTGAAEEVSEEPEKQGRSGESLYAESEGYAREDAGAAEAEQAVDEAVNNQPKRQAKKTPDANRYPAETVPGAHKITVPKVHEKDASLEAASHDAVKVKKAVEMAKPMPVKDGASAIVVKEPVRQTVKKPDKDAPIVDKNDSAKTAVLQTAAKQPSASAAEVEGNKLEAALKTPAKIVRWYIQVGSFNKKENAMSVWDSLRGQGLPTSLDTVQTDKGTSYRLRVGPELDEKKAKAMQARLDKLNIKAFLISE